MKYARKDKFGIPHSVADVLKLALEQEKSSYDFYDRLLNEAKFPALKVMLQELSNEEKRHIQRIQLQLEH